MLSDQTIKLFKQKQPLFICIFSVLILQLIITFTVFYYLKDSKNPLLENLIKKYPKLKENPIIFFFIIPLFITIILLTFINIIQSFPIKLILLSIFAVFKGFFLTLAKSTISDETIMFALLGTITIFGLMLLFTTFLINMNVDFLKYGIYFFYGLLILILLQLINIFFVDDDIFTKILNFMGVILFSIYIIYDTYVILYKPTSFNNDCISGAIDYYIDFISIFTRLANEE
tara:strand:- start:2026 stop:2715 length:690 start_codon:yes stop_codon:yes gene_type:complete